MTSAAEKQSQTAAKPGLALPPEAPAAAQLDAGAGTRRKARAEETGRPPLRGEGAVAGRLYAGGRTRRAGDVRKAAEFHFPLIPPRAAITRGGEWEESASLSPSLEQLQEKLGTGHARSGARETPGLGGCVGAAAAWSGAGEIPGRRGSADDGPSCGFAPSAASAGGAEPGVPGAGRGRGSSGEPTGRRLATAPGPRSLGGSSLRRPTGGLGAARLPAASGWP